MNETEKEITDYRHSNKHVTTSEFNKLTSNIFAARLKLGNLASKINNVNFVNNADFDESLSNLNKKKYFK